MHIDDMTADQLYDAAMDMRAGVLDYLHSTSPSASFIRNNFDRDLTWHPLFTATRELFAFMLNRADRLARDTGT